MITQELIEKFASGDGVFFVGAGLSIGGGLRSWDELMRPLREDLRTARAIAGKPTGDLDHLPHLALAQAYEAEVNRVRLIELLRSNLPRHGGGPTEVHAALFKFPIREIYTTNFDEFLEMAALKQRRTYHPVVRPSDADDTPRPSDDGTPAVRIVKIHGDYDDKESIIITQEDYRLVRDLKGRIWADMDQMFRTKTVLFLGYSFNDPDLQNLIKDVRERAGRFPRNAYALLVEDAPGEKERLREFGIQAIPLQINRKQTINEGLAEWLNEFAAKVAQHSHRVGPAQPVPHNLPPRRPLIGRDAELRALLSMLEWEGNCIPLCGDPGVGKTNLALAAAHHCAQAGKLFEYVIWISARERDPRDPRDPRNLLTDLLTAVERTTGYSLGMPPVELRREQAAELLRERAAELLRERLARFFYVAKRHPLLIIIDHLELRYRDELSEILTGDLGSSCVLLTAEKSVFEGGALLKGFEGGALLKGFSGPDATNFLTSLIRSGPSDHPLVYADDKGLVDFAEAFHGNPMLLSLGFRLVSNGFDLRTLIRFSVGIPNIELLKIIHEMIWNRLHQDSRQVLFVASKFATLSIDAKIMRSVSQMDFRSFMMAVDDCRSYGLLEAEKIRDREFVRIRVHPTTIQFVRGIKEIDEETGEVQKRIIDYYLDLIHRCAKRRRPDKRYWDALVSDSMRELDPEWANIRLAAKWALSRDPRKYLHFPMLLLHYMDSRLYNTDRLRGAQHASTLLTAQADWEGAALMHLDALAWTRMEQDELDKAHQEVDEGLEHAAKLEEGSRARVDLETLGAAWRSRIAVERGDLGEARRLTADALKRRHVSPWIRVRVLMVAGDVHLRGGNGQRALKHYEDALKLAAETYGSEGNGYELLPRIGLACISINNLERAKAIFSELAEASDIPVARLHGEYGLGLAEHKHRNTVEARKRVEDAAFELKDRRSRMLLLKAFEQQYSVQREVHKSRLQAWHELGKPSSPKAILRKLRTTSAPRVAAVAPARRLDRASAPRREPGSRKLAGVARVDGRRAKI